MNTEILNEITELEELESIYCEMHKDVYGTKARWYRADSVEQARADLAALSKALEIELVREKEMQIEAIAGFMALAENYGGVAAAKRYQHQAYGTEGNDSFLEFELGLPYGFFKEIEQTS